MKNLITVLSLALLSGCATMVNQGKQYVTINAKNEADNEITYCNLVNEEGEWDIQAHRSIQIERDGNPLEISCTNKVQEGDEAVEPKFSVGILTTQLIFMPLFPLMNIIAITVDAANNSYYEYPAVIPVDMTPIK